MQKIGGVSMKRNNIFIIWFTYFLVFSAYFGVTYYYNASEVLDFSYEYLVQNIDMMITLAMFLIVFVIFTGASVKLSLLNKLSRNLKKVSDSIEETAKSTAVSQWDKLSKDENLFSNKLWLFF